MRPADLLAATEFAVGALRPCVERDWSVTAGSLEWDVTFTLAHVAGSMTKATAYLASAATTWSPLVITASPQATNSQLLDGIEVAARALAFVAEHADRETRGFHAWGMSDATAFLARSATEALVHGWDVASGLDIAFDPPPDLCSPILRRRFPWVAEDVEPWTTMLAAEGRSGSPGWLPVEIPLDEWDGVIPTAPRPPATAWTWHAASGKWLPTS